MKDKFKIVKRKIKVKVKEEIVEFEEIVKINLNSKETVYDRELEIGNTNRALDAYNKKIINI